MSGKEVSWAIIGVSVVIAFIILLRDTLFNGQPLDSTNFIMAVIIDMALAAGYAIATSVAGKKDGIGKTG